MDYVFHLAIFVAVYVVLAMSLNIVVGYCGLLTLAHASYFSIGAYVYAIASARFGVGYALAVCLAVAIPAVLSLAISLPSWKFQGDVFVLISLSVQAVFYAAFYNWTAVTNGPFGIAGIAKPAIVGIEFETLGSQAALAWSLTILALATCWFLVSSPWGRLLRAIRDDESAASSLGKDVRRVRVEAFGFSCATAGLSGAIYASYVGYIDASMASLDESILLLCMVLIGGVGNYRGPLIGVAVLIAIPEILRVLAIPSSVASDIRLMAYGLLLVIMMQFRPQGLWGVYRIE